MNRTRFFAALILVSLIVLSGCLGGSGGGGTATFEKDVAGITATLNRFAAALQAGDAASSGVFAQITGPEQTSRILYVQDFGKDLSNPADNQKWEFRINPTDITQPGPDVAVVRASKVMSDGSALWLVFAMVREQGVWVIESLTVEESGVASFVSANYYPIIPGSSLVYYVSGGSSAPSLYTESISSAETYQANGMVFYKEVYSPGSPFYTSKRAQIFDNSSFYVGTNAQGEVWGYSPEINNGQPYRLLKAAYSFGETETITEVGSYETIITRLTIATQTTYLKTPLRTFQVVPVLEQSTYIYPDQTSTETTMLYLADGIGVVGSERYGFTSSSPVFTELLFERYANGKFESNIPSVTATSASQNVVKGQGMVPVEFASTGGTAPISWGINGNPSGVSISPTGVLSGLPESIATQTYSVIVSATDVYNRTGTFYFTLNVTEPGLFYMPNFYPAVPNDQYTYVPLNGGVASPARVITSIYPDFKVINGITLYREGTSEFDPSAPAFSIRPSLRAGIKAGMNPALRPSLRAQTAPADEPYYRGIDTEGNIWQQQLYTNGGQPYKIFNAWNNPGDTYQYVQNYDDGTGTPFTATTDITISGALPGGLLTPLATFYEILKVTNITTLDFGAGVFKFKSELYFQKGVGVVGYFSYPDEVSTTPDYQELLLESNLGGTITRNVPQINTPVDLGSFTSASSVSINLLVSGGNTPYNFAVQPGSVLPEGLTLSPSGLISGTLIAVSPGTSFFTIVVKDKYFQTAEQTFQMTIN